MTRDTGTRTPDLLADLHEELESARMRLHEQDHVREELLETLENLHLHQEELRAQNEELKAAQSARETSARRYRALFDLSPVANFVVSRDGTIVELNVIACTMLGVSRASILRGSLSRFVSEPRSREELSSMLRHIAAGDGTRSLELDLVGSGGRTTPVALTASLEDDGATIHIGAADLTAHRAMESERKKGEAHQRLAATVFEESNEGIVITDADQRILRVNRAFSLVTGYPESEVVGKTPRILSSHRQGRDFYQNMWRQIAATGRWQGEIWNRRRNGEVYPEWLGISSVLGDDGQVKHFVGIFSDISDPNRVQTNLERFAYFDPLTDLPNRALFSDRLKHALLRARRDNRHVALLYLDLDRFKAINDSLGHPIGDELLQHATARIKACIRESDTVARLGGDEFAVVMPDIADDESAARVALAFAERVRHAIREPFRLGTQEIVTTTSIGLAVFPRDGDTFSDLVKHADTAMYQAKREGGDACCAFSTQMAARVSRRLYLETALRLAIRDERLDVAFQPVVDIRRRMFVGVEALLRWKDAGVDVSPDEMVPVLEDTGMIHEASQWVLRRACEHLKRWDADPAMPSISLALNISPRELKQPGFSERVRAVLADVGVDSKRLVLEITERHVLEHDEEIVTVLGQLRASGFQLALDDFGTGHSTLSRLRNLPFDIVKIDRVFIHGLPADKNDLAIASAIVTMARHMGLQVIAEGAETAEQADCVLQIGGDLVQGYHYARPMPGDMIPAWHRGSGLLAVQS